MYHVTLEQDPANRNSVLWRPVQRLMAKVTAHKNWQLSDFPIISNSDQYGGFNRPASYAGVYGTTATSTNDALPATGPLVLPIPYYSGYDIPNTNSDLYAAQPVSQFSWPDPAIQAWLAEEQEIQPNLDVLDWTGMEWMT